MSPRVRRASRAEELLEAYFAEAESAAGLRSIHGALVASKGGGGSSAARDRNWVDDYGRRSRVRAHARVHAALLLLDHGHVAALLAYYGSPPWPGPAEDTPDADVGCRSEAKRKRHWSRAQPPPEVRGALGVELGRVALLVPALLKLGGELEPPRRLQVVCKAGGVLLAKVEAQALALHRAALVEFCGWHRPVLSPPPPPDDRPRGRGGASRRAWTAVPRPELAR